MSALLFVWCEFCLRVLFLVALYAVAGCVLVAIGTFICSRHVRSKSFHHLKKFPGRHESIPFWRALAQDWLFHRLARETGRPFGHHVFHAVNGFLLSHQQHKEGAIIEYVGGWPNLYLCSASLFEEMLTQTTNISKSFGYSFLEPWLGKGLLLSSGSRWRTQRKMLVPAFHFRILDEFAAAMNAQTRVFMDLMEKKDAEEDVIPYISALALDITCETIMGTGLNAQTTDTGSRYLAGVHRLAELFMIRGHHPLQWFDIVYKRTEGYREFMRLSNETQGFTRKVIEERKAELLENPELLSDVQTTDSTAFAKSKKPFLDMMLQKHLKGEISVEDMRSQVDTLMFAGHDTTSMALTYVLYLTGYYPEVQQKLRQEVDSVFGSLDPACDVTADHLRELKYMDMVIREAQRVLPSVPLMGRTIDEDMLLDGKVVPKGTDITISIYALHHDPNVWDKPEEFIPERFSPEQSKNRNPFVFTPFSAGLRNCIGQKYAVLETKIVLTWMLRRFNWKSLDHRDQIEFAYEIVLRPRNKMRIAFRRRR